MRWLALAVLLTTASACSKGSASSSDGDGGGQSMAGGGQAASAGASGSSVGGRELVAGSDSGGSGATGGSGGSISQPFEDAPNDDVTFKAAIGVVLNPERGFFATTDLVQDQDLSTLRQSGVTLVHSYVRLDDYRTSDIPQSLLDQVSAGFERVRKAGLKVILRFAYNFGPYPDSEPDAPKEWVLKHLTQLTPLLAENADVIAVVQAGFIGAWGEWHTSTNDLTEPATRKAILEALLSAVPSTRFVQLRYPAYKRELYGDALTAQDAFGMSPAARIGHHNDCFVSSATDVGTYPDAQVDAMRDYVGADTAFVPFGGETCAVDAPRSECFSAIDEMTKLHMSYINREYEPNVIASWAPCREEMDRRLGYRLFIDSADLPSAVKPGGSFTLTLRLKNLGFAAPFNARPVFLVLRGNGTVSRAQLRRADPRRWLGDNTLQARVRLPSQTSPGSYALWLWLPDAAESLRMRSDYALRLANDDVWDETTGENLLGKLEITVEARGTAVSDAQTFAVLAE